MKKLVNVVEIAFSSLDSSSARKIKDIRITKISKSYKWLQSFWCLADHLWFHLVQPHARLLRSCLTLREMTPPFLWFSAAFCNENSQHPDLQDDRGLSDESQGDTEKIKMMKMAVSLNPSHQTKTILTNLVLNLSTAFTIVSIISYLLNVPFVGFLMCQVLWLLIFPYWISTIQ